MRGKHFAERVVVHSRRIIPAHAGQTASSSTAASRATDHPRACGANQVGLDDLTNPDGSSPRMRGKPEEDADHPVDERIIPAHAGQTQSGERVGGHVADHPRACGANSNKGSATVSASGSSPRMRGKRLLVREHRAHVRIIPAHAGQTSMTFKEGLNKADHPRACGANETKTPNTRITYGSSPRMRGKP